MHEGMLMTLPKKNENLSVLPAYSMYLYNMIESFKFEGKNNYTKIQATPSRRCCNRSQRRTS